MDGKQERQEFNPPRDIKFIRTLAFDGLVNYTEKGILRYDVAKEFAALIRKTEIVDDSVGKA